MSKLDNKTDYYPQCKSLSQYYGNAYPLYMCYSNDSDALSVVVYSCRYRNMNPFYANLHIILELFYIYYSNAFLSLLLCFIFYYSYARLYWTSLYLNIALVAVWGICSDGCIGG